jgi:hypothetical protein
MGIRISKVFRGESTCDFPRHSSTLTIMIRTASLVQRVAARASRKSFQSIQGARTYALSAENLPKSNSPIVSELKFFNSVTGDGTGIPTYRVLDGSGKPLEGAVVPEVHTVKPVSNDA